MLIRRAPSGKHILIWIAVLLLLAVALLLGALVLRALIRHPAAALPHTRGELACHRAAAAAMREPRAEPG